jgi:death-on-curing protein
MTPKFLSAEQVVRMQARQVRQFGGEAGVRDRGLLESAVAMPRQTFAAVYLHETLGAMAAAYLYHICKNHPFVDGNKRAALAAAESFLRVNGLRLQIDTAALTAFVLGVADGTLSKEQTTAFIRTHLREDPTAE